MVQSNSSYPPSSRLKKRVDYLFVQNKGKKFRSKHLLLSVVFKDDSEDSRLGITVTTKVDKSAVRRNRIKRVVREFYRKNKSNLHRSVDLVFIALKGVSEVENEQIRRELSHLYRKAGLL